MIRVFISVSGVLIGTALAVARATLRRIGKMDTKPMKCPRCGELARFIPCGPTLRLLGYDGITDCPHCGIHEYVTERPHGLYVIEGGKK